MSVLVFQSIGSDLPILRNSYNTPKHSLADWHSSVANKCQDAEIAREDSERVNIDKQTKPDNSKVFLDKV